MTAAEAVDKELRFFGQIGTRRAQVMAAEHGIEPSVMSALIAEAEERLRVPTHLRLSFSEKMRQIRARQRARA